MGRSKTKDCKPLTLRMDAAIYDRLASFCLDSGQSKTGAIERALAMYLDDYEKKQALLKEAERK